MIELTDKQIDAGGIYNRLNSDGAGSVVVHVGIVKGRVDGKNTGGIKFKKAGDLEGEMKALEIELREKWDIIDALLIRRVGDLKIGDVIMAVGFSAETRDPAFGACRDAVEGFKKFKNIEKVELFEK